MKIEAGQVFEVNNQGKTITPQHVRVTIVWVEDDAVHYRLGDSPIIHQTPKARFIEIVEGKK